jgi:hypothetical protein
VERETQAADNSAWQQFPDASSGAECAVQNVQSSVGAAAESIKDRARDIAEQQKTASADQIAGVAQAAEAAANELRDKVPRAAEYVHQVAGRLEGVAGAIRERNVDDLLVSVADFARQQPALFFVGSIATGFALSRFIKSSSSRQG